MGRHGWHYTGPASETDRDMIRFLLENIFFFLLPTLAYVAYVAYQRQDWPGLWHILRQAPLLRLFLLGGALMMSTLFLLSSYTGHSPLEGYTPPAFEDGQVRPGHSTEKPGSAP